MTGPGAVGPVVVVGGGIGGLAAALALARKGIASRVVERRQEHSEVGAGIQVGPNGTRILEALGVLPRLAGALSQPEAIVARAGDTGHELARLPLGAWIAERHGAPYVTLHRADLHAALVATVEAEPRVTVETGFSVAGISERGDAVEVGAGDGRTRSAAVAIVADGLWSGLRARGTVGPPLAPAHRTAYRAVIESAAPPPGVDAGNVGIWLAPRLHAVHYPVRAGREIALVVIVEETVAPGTWDSAATADAVGRHVAGAARPLRDLVAAATRWRCWALGEAQPYGPFALGRMALLGDAAHPILPFLAQGAVMALEDAVVLAEELTRGEGDVPAQLARYDRRRRPRVGAVAAASRRNGIVYHLSGPPAWARDAVMRMAPGARLMARYDWLYGWRG